VHEGASFVKNHLKLISCELIGQDIIEGGVTAEHFEVEVLPVFANRCHDKLALLHRHVFEYYLKDGVGQSSPKGTVRI